MKICLNYDCSNQVFFPKEKDLHKKVDI